MIGGVDIGGTKIAVGMVDEGGAVLAVQESPTEAEKGLDHGLKKIVQMVQQTAKQAGGNLEGIGVGCTGPVFPERGTVGNVEFLPGWEGANLVRELFSAFKVPVAIENDADAATLGEWAWGVGRGTESFILVTVGTGIGAGLIMNGRLYRGVDGSHPEIGHHVIDPDGPACFCGAHGCWESLASGSAMERWIQGQQPQLPYNNAWELCEAADEGNPIAQVAVHRTARYLAIGLANLVTIFSPEMIALCGGLLQSWHLFWPEIQETIQANCGLVPHERIKMVRSSLGSYAGMIGAAQVWYYRYSTAHKG